MQLSTWALVDAGVDVSHSDFEDMWARQFEGPEWKMMIDEVRGKK